MNAAAQNADVALRVICQIIHAVAGIDVDCNTAIAIALQMADCLP